MRTKAVSTRVSVTAEAHTLKQALANKHALKQLRRERFKLAALAAIGSGKEGNPLSRSALRPTIRGAVMERIAAVCATDKQEFCKGWNYDPIKQAAESAAAGFYLSAKDSEIVIAGCARNEYNAAFTWIEANMDTGNDADQAIREWMELDAEEQFRVAPVGPSKHTGKKYIRTLKKEASAMLSAWIDREIVGAHLNQKEAIAKLKALEALLAGKSVPAKRVAKKAA